MKIQVICKIIQHGNAYGKTGDIIEVPDNIGEDLIKGKKAKAVKTEESANSETK